ncbi:MAG: PEGA domain-containing protein [Caldisericia bacterium]|nr:PEGA domain-containing protein [Caldisericia bacterium]
MKKILICLIILGLMGLVTNGCKKETKLKIDTIPSNAMLYINSQYKGKTPININLFPGEYQIEIEKENYFTLRKILKISNFGKNEHIFELKKVPTLFSKEFNENISLIKIFNNKVYLKTNDSQILILNSKNGELISKINLKEIDTNNLPCKEEDNDIIELDKNIKYSPKEIINLYLKAKEYLLKSHCFKTFEKRKEKIKETFKEIFINQKLIDNIINELKENFLEISWVDDISNSSSEFKIFLRFYGEYEKKDLACFYIEELYLKKYEVEEVDFPFEEIPPEWIFPCKYIPGIHLSSIHTYNTYLLKKINDRWFIYNINGVCEKNEKLTKETDSLFYNPSFGDFPNPPKIKDMIPLPEDINKDLERSKYTKIKNEICLKIRDINVYDEKLFIQTNCNLFVFDSELNPVSKYLNYLPLNSNFAIGIYPNCKDLKEFDISYLDLNSGSIKWKVTFNGDLLYFINSSGSSLFFLQIYNNKLFLIKIDSKNGQLISRKEIIKIDESGKNINLVHNFFSFSKDKILFYLNNKIFLFNLNGDILWKKNLNESFSLLWATEKYIGINSHNSILILSTNEGKLLEEIKLIGVPKKIYILENLLFYSEEFDKQYYLHVFDLEKDEKIFILKIYNENFIINKENLIFQVEINEISSINLSLIKSRDLGRELLEGLN